MSEREAVFIIAEAGVNHNGDPDLAVELVESAVDCGADAVKFQTFSAEALVTRAADKAAYQKRSTGGSTQLEMLKTLELPRVLHFQLKDLCEQDGVEFMSTAFDARSLEFLVKELGVKRLKIPSGEITNGPFLLEHAQYGLPMLLSTGMANLEEVEHALGAIAFGLSGSNETPCEDAFKAALSDSVMRSRLAELVTVLHCTTEYPAPFDDLNLAAMGTMEAAFGLPVGYSDHSLGIGVPIAAVARGATVLEKHFTLDVSLPGPDHASSLEPAGFRQMVESIRAVEQSIGSPEKKPAASELPNISIARRSLVAATEIRKGQPFSERNLAAKRPAGGISPMQIWSLIGQPADRDYAIDEMIGKRNA